MIIIISRMFNYTKITYILDLKLFMQNNCKHFNNNSNNNVLTNI